MATAMTVGAGATGARAWLATHSPAWLTPRRLKQATAAILAIGVLASGIRMSPGSSAPEGRAAETAAASSRQGHPQDN